MENNFQIYFPFSQIRPQQQEFFDFFYKNINNCRFIILEAPTGTGKSAIAYTLSKWIQDNFPYSEKQGSYMATTQKILQEQYTNDFPDIANIWSKSNYQCCRNRGYTCEQSQTLHGILEEEPCGNACMYNKCIRSYYESSMSLTNLPFLLNQVQYSPNLLKRQLLIIDECHNLEAAMVEFVSIRIFRNECESDLKINFMESPNIDEVKTWVEETYLKKIQQKQIKIAEEIQSNSKSKKVISLSKIYNDLERKIEKCKRFLTKYNNKNWVLSQNAECLEMKPIHCNYYTEDHLFKIADKVLLMSGTILDKETFCSNNGIPSDQCCFLSLESPFPVANRQVLVCPVGSMSYKNIEKTMPNMNTAVQNILNMHKGQKGIIHTNNYKIAKYLQEKDPTGRLSIHTSENRQEVYKNHIESDNDSVLISPSFTEGIDLNYDLSRFQVICKIPYPYLNDNYVKEKMKRCKNWYEWMTIKTIIQALGRSIRSEDDHAVSYILDADWNMLYSKSSFMFPNWFKKAIIKI